MADPLHPPSIPGLRRGGWIDLEALGSDDLLTYIKYDGIAINDVLWPNWRGCSAEGKVLDLADSRTDVSEENGYDPELGMPVLIRNDVFTGMDKGYAFYSYALGDPSNPVIRGDESLRIFVYLGKRPPTPLPVPQIKESHDLALDPESVGSQGATAIAPPYSAMNVGDNVVFKWLGYDKDGFEDDPYSEGLEIKAEHLGKPLHFTVPKAYMNFIRGGHAQISYTIEYANGQGPSDSESQIVRIETPTSALLPEIKIKDYTDGPIDPGRFPNGMTLQVQPVPAGIQLGEVVVMYCMGVTNVIRSMQVDRSNLDSGVLEFHLEREWLLSNVGRDVEASYQYAGIGVGESATPLTLQVRASQRLPAPVVEGASNERPDEGTIPASVDGAYVRIPEEVLIGPGVRAEVHWMGHPNGGQVIVTTPVNGSQKRFHIPRTAIAANMATELQPEKRFDVFYKLIPEGDDGGQPSDAPFRLRIDPIASTRYPIVECEEAKGTGVVSLSKLESAGATLVIGEGLFEAWPFMDVGQLLTIEANGVAMGGGPLKEPVRTAAPVTTVEVNAKKITARLRLDYLKSLKRDHDFTISAKVSFDGGDSYREFQSGNIRLTD